MKLVAAGAILLAVSAGAAIAAPLGLTTLPSPTVNGSTNVTLLPGIPTVFGPTLDGIDTAGTGTTTLPTSGGLQLAFTAFLDPIGGLALDPGSSPMGVLAVRDLGAPSGSSLFLTGQAIDFGHDIGTGADTLEILFTLTDPTASAFTDFGGAGSQVLLTLFGDFGDDAVSVFDPVLYNPNLAINTTGATARYSLAQVAPIPLPAGLVLLGTAVVGLFGIRRRKSAD